MTSRPQMIINVLRLILMSNLQPVSLPKKSLITMAQSLL